MWYYFTHTLKQLKLKYWQNHMLVRTCSNWNSHTVLAGVLKTLQPFSKLAVSYTVTHLPLLPSISSHRYLPKRNKNICQHKYLYKNVVEALLVIIKKRKQCKISIKEHHKNKQTKNPTVAYSYYCYYSAITKRMDYWYKQQLDESQTHYVVQKKKKKKARHVIIPFFYEIPKQAEQI